MSKLLSNTLYYSIGNFVSKGLSFLLLPLYLNYLSPEEYGIVTSMQVLSGIIVIFFTFGLERSIYRLFFDHNTEFKRKIFLGTIAISIFTISLIVCFFLFAFSETFVKIYKTIPFHPFYTYSIITAVLMTFELVPFIALQVREKAAQYLSFSLILLVVRVVPVIWFVVYANEGAVGMLKGAMIGNLLALLLLIPLTLSQVVLRFNFRILKNTLAYCLPLVPLVLSSWIVNMSDRIFIERYFGTYDVGIYSLAYKIGQLVQFVSLSILMAYNPVFYKVANSEDESKAKIKLGNINNMVVHLLMYIGFSVSFLSKDITYLFFDREYLGAYQIVPLIALGYFFIQLVSLQNLSFHQHKKSLVIMNINLVAAFINIAMNFLLIKEFGYLGAAWATVLTQIILFSIVYTFSRKYYFIPFNWVEILPLIIIFSSIVIINVFFLEYGVYPFLMKLFAVLFIGFLIVIFKRKSISELRVS